MIVETITNGSASEFDFSSIPTGYSRLILAGYVRSSQAVTADTVYIFFNAGYTVTDYHSQLVQGSNSSTPTAFEVAAPSFCTAPGSSSPTGAYVFFRAVIEGYNDSTIIKGCTCTAGMMDTSTTGLRVQQLFASHKTLTDAITQITIRADGHSTDGLLGTVRLYAEV